MTNSTEKQATVVEKIEATGLATCSPWNDRIYVNIKAADRSFRGCSTHKVWIDSEGQVHNETGRGTVPSAYRDACEQLTEVLGVEITY